MTKMLTAIIYWKSYIYLEGNWPALSLDGCGCLVALLVDLIEDVVWEAGFLKGGDGRWAVSLGVPLNANLLGLPELFSPVASMSK